MRAVIVILLGLMVLASCGSPEAADANDVSQTVSAQTNDRRRSPVQNPRALYLVACGGQAVVPGELPGQCILAVAGGKRFLFGTPAGAAMTLSLEDLQQLDAVFLFSLASKDIEGLDEIRRASWAAGRSGELWVYGPEGIGETVLLLDQVHLYGDAIATMNDGARGFRDLPLRAFGFRLVDLSEEGRPLMDRGDVVVSGVMRDGVRAGYQLRYNGRDASGVVAIGVCPSPEENADAVVLDADSAETCGTSTGLKLLMPSVDGPMPGWDSMETAVAVKISP